MTTIADDNTPNKLLVEQGSTPATPAAGKQRIFIRTSDHKLCRVDSSGAVTVIEGGGGTSLSNSNISPTTSNVSAAANTRYFANVSGLTANRNFVVPAGAVGDVIELNIKTGDDTYALIIKGDTGVSINGGSTATEWSRLFITGEVIQLVADTTSNWQVVRDGRIPCVGHLKLSGSDTTNTGGTPTLPTWDTKYIDKGEIGDTTNYRFNIRRANNYRVSGSYISYNVIGAGGYIWVQMYVNSVEIPGGYIGVASTGTIQSIVPVSTVPCAVGDPVEFKYQTNASNIGILNDTRTFFQIEEVF